MQQTAEIGTNSSQTEEAPKRIKRLNMIIPPPLKKRLHTKAVEQDLSITQAVIEALELWLSTRAV